MKSIFLLLLAVVLHSPLAQSQPTSSQRTESDVVAEGIDHLRNLEYDQAIMQLETWIKSHPDDLRAHNYLATSILYQEMFHRGVLESRVYGHGGDVFKASKVDITPEFQQKLLSALDKAQSLADQRAKSDPKDKEALYWAGVSHGTRATYHFTLRKEYLAALHEATDAFRRHQSLLELDPDYVDAYLIVGMNNYIVGSLPWYIKALASLSGRHGDKAEGMKQVKRVTEEGNYAREDARLMLAVLYQREKMYREALKLYEEMERAHPRNCLLPGEVATLHGLLNEWPAAAAVDDSILRRHHSGEAGYGQIPLARTLYYTGDAYERSEKPEIALARYLEAGSMASSDQYRYRALVRGCDILVQLRRREEAIACYQRVTDETPNSDEAIAARQSLKRLVPN